MVRPVNATEDAACGRPAQAGDHEGGHRSDHRPAGQVHRRVVSRGRSLRGVDPAAAWCGAARRGSPRCHGCAGFPAGRPARCGHRRSERPDCRLAVVEVARDAALSTGAQQAEQLTAAAQAVRQADQLATAPAMVKELTGRLAAAESTRDVATAQTGQQGGQARRGAGKNRGAERQARCRRGAIGHRRESPDNYAKRPRKATPKKDGDVSAS